MGTNLLSNKLSTDGYGYINSSNIHVYPCAFRGENIDQEAKMMTENTISHIAPNISNEGYVINYTASSGSGDDWKPASLEFSIAGYYFKIFEAGSGDFAVTFGASSDCYVGLKLKDWTLFSGDAVKSRKIESWGASDALDSEDDYFYGLKFATTIDNLSGATYTLQICNTSGFITNKFNFNDLAAGKKANSYTLEVSEDSFEVVGDTTIQSAKNSPSAKITLTQSGDNSGIALSGKTDILGNTNITGSSITLQNAKSNSSAKIELDSNSINLIGQTEVMGEIQLRSANSDLPADAVILLTQTNENQGETIPGGITAIGKTNITGVTTIQADSSFTTGKIEVKSADGSNPVIELTGKTKIDGELEITKDTVVATKLSIKDTSNRIQDTPTSKTLSQLAFIDKANQDVAKSYASIANTFNALTWKLNDKAGNSAEIEFVAQGTDGTGDSADLWRFNPINEGIDLGYTTRKWNRLFAEDIYDYSNTVSRGSDGKNDNGKVSGYFLVAYTQSLPVYATSFAKILVQDWDTPDREFELNISGYFGDNGSDAELKQKIFRGLIGVSNHLASISALDTVADKFYLVLRAKTNKVNESSDDQANRIELWYRQDSNDNYQRYKFSFINDTAWTRTDDIVKWKKPKVLANADLNYAKGDNIIYTDSNAHILSTGLSSEYYTYIPLSEWNEQLFFDSRAESGNSYKYGEIFQNNLVLNTVVHIDGGEI